MADEMNGEREAFEAWLPKVWSRATVTDSEGHTDTSKPSGSWGFMNHIHRKKDTQS